MKAFVAALALVSALTVSAPATAQAQEPTVQQFMTRIERLPPGPLALLAPDAHRLKRIFETALSTVATEQRRAQQAGRRPVTCIPDQFNMSSDEAFAYFNAIPRTRRERMTVTEGARLWMAHKYPCP